MKVYEAIAEIVEREGVEAIFAVLGDANMKWLSEFTRRTGREVHHARHEGSAIGMADGYARASGRLAICSVTCGPGVSLLATTLIAASRNRTPLLVIAGGAPIGDKYYEQAFDQRRFVEASETIAEDLRSPASLEEDLRDSFYLARTVGPVVFSAPFDMQEEEAVEHADEYTPSTSLISAPQEIQPDPAAIDRAADLIGGSTRPIIIAGRGALDARPEIIQLADATGALLATSMMAKGLFDGDARDLGLAGGFASDISRARFQEADCVIGVGAGLNHYTTDHGNLFPNAEVIHIVDERVALMNGRRRPQGRPGGRKVADCYVQGRARPTLRVLLEYLQSKSDGELTRIEQWAPQIDAPDVPEIASDDPDLHPAAVMEELNRAAAPDSRFIIGLGHHWWFPLTYLRDRWTAESFQLTTEFGSIGQGFTGAIGAALAEPERKHVLIEGDASFLMAVQELDTAARYGVNLLVVIMNDRGLGAEALKLEALGFDASPARIETPDFATIAKTMGCDGMQVRTLDEFREAITAYQAEGGVRVLDVQISQRVMSGPYVAKYAKPRTA
jgi:thiamine pyrophosphate-dependent acetolactate synthase large subunit-like protein